MIGKRAEESRVAELERKVGRQAMEKKAQQELQARLDKYGAGIQVLRIKLQDVHPSLEVVDAFREVSGAYEEKNRLVNEAEGYRNEQEMFNLECWALTAEMILHTADWIWLYEHFGYTGDYEFIYFE